MKQIICGIDEAGRGPLAGPVTAAAVILPDDFEIEFLNCSLFIFFFFFFYIVNSADFFNF